MTVLTVVTIELLSLHHFGSVDHSGSALRGSTQAQCTPFRVPISLRPRSILLGLTCLGLDGILKARLCSVAAP
eukprot:1798119-Rhodomonas_salina.1